MSFSAVYSGSWIPGPVRAALMLSVMVVTVLTVHRAHGFYAYNNGAEVPIVYSTGAVTVALAGPGQYSLDRMVGITSFVPNMVSGSSSHVESCLDWQASPCGIHQKLPSSHRRPPSTTNDQRARRHPHEELRRLFDQPELNREQRRQCHRPARTFPLETDLERPRDRLCESMSPQLLVQPR